jgi:hypothetical protein
MDIVLIGLRLIHIVAAVSWFGMALVTFAFLIPAERLAGESGLRFMKAFYTGTPMARAFPIAAVTATLAGILLYITGSASHFSQTGNIVLGIGAVAGILAAGHGGAATGRYTGEYVAALAQNLGDKNDPLTGEQIAAISAIRDKYVLHVRISFLLMTVALIFMASARYF